MSKIIRGLDSLGRITLPKQFRDKHGLDMFSKVEIEDVGDSIIIKKYDKSCIFCNSRETGELVDYEGKSICVSCLNKIVEIIDSEV